MTIQPIGATSMALYITPNDLKEHGLTPDQLAALIQNSRTTAGAERKEGGDHAED